MNERERKSTRQWIQLLLIFYRLLYQVVRLYLQHVFSDHDHLYDQFLQRDRTENQRNVRVFFITTDQISTIAPMRFPNSFWSICPSLEISYLYYKEINSILTEGNIRRNYKSNAYANRSSNSPWLEAEIARRNSSKLMLPSLFASNVANAYLDINRSQVGNLVEKWSSYLQ